MIILIDRFFESNNQSITNGKYATGSFKYALHYLTQQYHEEWEESPRELAERKQRSASMIAEAFGKVGYITEEKRRKSKTEEVFATDRDNGDNDE